MYMEMKQRNRVSPVPYLLVKPTEAEMHTLSTDVRSNRIAAFFFISAFAWMITVALLTAPFGFDNQSYVHLAILLVAFVVPIDSPWAVRAIALECTISALPGWRMPLLNLLMLIMFLLYIMLMIYLTLYMRV